MKKIILCSLLALSLAAPVWAADNWRLAIMAPTKIAAGQNIFFDYEILNPLNTSANIEYRAYLRCVNLPVKAVVTKTATVGPQARFYGRYQEKPALPGITAQDCVATIELVSPAKVKASKDLVVEASPALKAIVSSAGNPSCPANLSLFLKNQSCVTEKKSVYLVNSQVYLNGETSLAGASTRLRVNYPSGKVWETDLPAMIKLTEVGSYKLELAAQKSGYATVQETMYLSAIARKPQLKYLTK
jgi:hypothetical protein